MNKTRNLLLVLLLGLSVPVFAQGPPGGGGRPGGGPEQMIEREKQSVYKKITDLSKDQKLLLDGIYTEFASTLEETMKELRQGDDREAGREKMEALRKEKDLLIADVLNEDQFKIYQTISKPKRERKGDTKPDNQN
ncbi:MAG: hypothetical protein Roseis2KO_24970 [Roseivirga sp.]